MSFALKRGCGRGAERLFELEFFGSFPHLRFELLEHFGELLLVLMFAAAASRVASSTGMVT